jgi:hypothetical protein
MEVLIGYSTLVISTLVIYLVKKEYLTKDDLDLVKNQIKTLIRLKSGMNKKSYYKNEIINENSQHIHPSTLLLKSLRHLNFMSQLEDYLLETGHSNFKTEYLQQLERSKVEAQVSVIKSAQLLSNTLKMAA